ncbi:hypothetical protein P9314_15990 [Paenibacillus validus]|uniref:Uncharacterized protein n=1 Tax=Paenibacillus validus TaxID=44253 RepID=A0A7X2ZEN9_9BACL|nr:MULTISPECIES: hypothetical protein [Paenibacillus]MED4602187.1 hypothetical protein [Paenibacillus validus]MED4609565.1 hypothetical protein [Paenibacillus validus]MUG73459.1 hypothetical protein [Paenibacillus validus]
MENIIHREFEAVEPVFVTIEMVSHCGYCTQVHGDPYCRTPVHCTKFSGSCSPIHVNLATCMTCGEYKKST